ncbi:hypothetical protein WCLP8_1220003 [uncultured Gammaproteobacteria bacterium]
MVEPRAREPGNSQFRKIFPGGQLVMVGATSGVGLRSTPARYLLRDEDDADPGAARPVSEPLATSALRMGPGRFCAFRRRLGLADHRP